VVSGRWIARGSCRAARGRCSLRGLFRRALFEYGSDTEIAANLETLHEGTAPDAILVGSVTRDGEAMRALQNADRVATRPRTLEAFRSLAEQAGWSVQHVIERPFSYNLRLVKHRRVAGWT